MMCPEGWEVFQGRCYSFVNEDMTWPQAQSNCAMMDSMLVSVHSAQEYGFLQQLTSNNGNQNAWLGGFYLQDQWLWIDGSWFYNNSWGSESPDSSNPCLLLNTYVAWSNSPCNVGGFASICVKNSNVRKSIFVFA
ncbi:macrophage mannose receptor 1-like protein [Lates japonicus]|uniref:Macrophage mannose receptor 1-like protein n=1 Tax=Lates japonicus TaxID=270547 RepID=A0AAD3NBI1_LATJO|nr:macrophage mannose receptor 1-like protein [Lates japonicus]GLD69433.1 macrophage mannose receptor 1-like protein [Lates japonicus]